MHFNGQKEHENFYCFTNGLMHSEGTGLTGIRTSIARNINKIFNKNFSGEMARTGLVYAVFLQNFLIPLLQIRQSKINHQNSAL